MAVGRSLVQGKLQPKPRGLRRRHTSDGTPNLETEDASASEPGYAREPGRRYLRATV